MKTSGVMILKLIFSVLAIWAISYYIFFYLTINNPKEKDCKEYNGVLINSQYNKQTNDIQLKISNLSHKVFYINNVDTSILSYTGIKSLRGKEIKIYAVKRWSVIDPKSKYNHIARLSYEDEILYSEY